MMLEAGLVGARFIHFACTIVLFGGTLFDLYSGLPRIRSERLVRLLPAVLFVAAIGSLLTGLAWFLFTVRNRSGSLVDALDLETQWSVLSDTGFGQVWAARVVVMLLIVVLFGLCGASILGRRLSIFLAVLAATLLASLAGVGHTQVDDGVPAIVHVTSDAVHLLAAGALLGGLLPLGMVVASCRAKQPSYDDAVFVLSRFSGMAYLAVAALVASGAINGVFLIGSWSGLVGTSYGELLLSILGLFGLMLFLAALNRFWLIPALAKPPTAGESDRVLARLRHHILAEQILGVLIMGIVSLLGTLAPAIQGS
jgi:putative copper resistance protein D